MELQQLFSEGVILDGILTTLYLTLLSTLLAYIFGLPLGLVLYFTEKSENRGIVLLNKVLGISSIFSAVSLS